MIIQVIVILGLGVVLLFWEIFFLGYVQVPGDILFVDPLWYEAVPPGFKRPNNPLLGDHLSQFYVWHTLAANSMQNQGKIPLWNPYFFSGQPLLANAQPGLFYPANLLLFWLSPGQTANIRVIFNILTAGLFTFLFCRASNISPKGAILAAIAFAFSGALMVGPGHAYASSLVWLPLVMWAGEHFFNRSRLYFWALIVGLGVGLSILGGHPETVFHILTVFSLYLFSKLWFNPSGAVRRQVFLGFAVAIIVGFLISAVQLLPFTELLLESATTSRARIGPTIFYSPEWLPNLSTLVTLIFPNFFGNPAGATYLWPFANFQNYLEQSMYFGLVPLALAVGASVAARRNFSVTVLTILAAMCLAIALRLPLFEGISHLPIFSIVNNTRLKWIFTFLGAVLAGFGFDMLKGYISSRGNENRFSFGASAFVLLLAFLILGIIIIWKYVVAPTVEFQADSFSYHLLFTIFSLRQSRTTVTIIVIFLTIAGFVLVHKKILSPSRFEWLLISVTLVELIVLGRGYNTTMPESQIFPKIKLLDALKYETEPFRVMSPDGIFWPNYGAVYGVFQVEGYDLPVFRNFAEVYLAQGGSASHRQVWSPEWPLVDWMNVKYIVGTQPQNEAKYELIFAQGPIRIHRNKDALPRAYMVYAAEVIEDDQTALEVLTSGQFDFEHKVILKNNLSNDEMMVIDDASEKDQLFTVEFKAYENDQVILVVDTKTAGILVMSEVYTPGWQVEVDAKKTQLNQANHAFRAVFVPQGRHTVTFTYKPLSFLVGSLLSGLGLATLVVGLPLCYKYSAVSPGANTEM